MSEGFMMSSLEMFVLFLSPPEIPLCKSKSIILALNVKGVFMDILTYNKMTANDGITRSLQSHLGERLFHSFPLLLQRQLFR